MSVLGPTALRARNPMNLDCIFMSLSVRDLSPEMLVFEVPDMFANPMAPTPSTEVER
jgi:hypothetical protein